MTNYVLFIRDQGANDVLNFRPNEIAAKKALAAYVTKKTGRDLPSDPEAAVEEIASYFSRHKTFTRSPASPPVRSKGYGTWL